MAMLLKTFLKKKKSERPVMCLFHYFMDRPQYPDMVTLGNGAAAHLRSILHAGLVEVHLHRQRPRLLIGL